MRRRLGLGVVLALVLVVAAPAQGWEESPELVVYRSRGMDGATVDAAARTAAATGASSVVVHRGMLRLVAVTRAGVDVQRAPAGMAFPLAALSVDPAARPLIGEQLAEALSGGALLSERSAALRGAQPGDVLTLEGWNGQLVDVPLTAVVPDAEIDWHELVVPPQLTAGLGFHRPVQLWVWGSDQPGLLRWLLRPLEALGVAAVWQPQPGASGPPSPDRVLPTVAVKERFGEFAYRLSGPGDRIEIDPGWVDANIVMVDLPLLGQFPCHRAVVPYLRGALEELIRRGLDHHIDYQDFQRAGGCFNPRLMRGTTGFLLSRHSWGIAVDVNPSTNPYGGPVVLSAEVGEVFRRWGFAWGAGWGYPDGMHFEWTRVPDTPETGCSDLLLQRSAQAQTTWSVYPRQGRCP